MKTTEFKKGDLLKFKDNEVWIVTSPLNYNNSLMAKPFNDLAKNQNISMSIVFKSEYLQDNLIHN